MAYKKIHVSDVPKRPRKGKSRFERTPEWKMLKADLDKGLKQKEALQVLLTDSDKTKYGIQNRRTIARFLQKYLSEHKLPYIVRSFRRDDTDFFVIQHSSR